MKKIMVITMMILAVLVSGCGSSDSAAIKVCKDYLAMAEKMDNGVWFNEDEFASYFARNKVGRYVLVEASMWDVLTRRQAQLSLMKMSVSYDISDVSAQKLGQENGYEAYCVNMTVTIKISDGSKDVSRYTFVVISPVGKNEFKIQDVVSQRIG